MATAETKMLLAISALQGSLKKDIFSSDEGSRQRARAQFYVLQDVAPELGIASYLDHTIQAQDTSPYATIQSGALSLAKLCEDKSGVEYSVLDILYGLITTDAKYRICVEKDGIDEPYMKEVGKSPVHCIAVDYKGLIGVSSIDALREKVEENITHALQRDGHLKEGERYKLMLSTKHTLVAWRDQDHRIIRQLNGISLDGRVGGGQPDATETPLVSPAAPHCIKQWVEKKSMSPRKALSEQIRDIIEQKGDDVQGWSAAHFSAMKDSYEAAYPYFLVDILSTYDDTAARLFQEEPELYRFADILGIVDDKCASVLVHTAADICSNIENAITFVEAFRKQDLNKEPFSSLLEENDREDFRHLSLQVSDRLELTRSMTAYREAAAKLVKCLSPLRTERNMVDFSKLDDNSDPEEVERNIKSALDAFIQAQNAVFGSPIVIALQGVTSGALTNWKSPVSSLGRVYDGLRVRRTELAEQAAKFQKSAKWYGGDQHRLNRLFLAPSLPSNLSEAKPQDWVTQAGDVEAGLAFLALLHVQAFMKLSFVKRLDDESVPQAVKQHLSSEWDKEWNKLEGALCQRVWQEADLVETVQAAGQAIQQAIEDSINAASDKVNNVLKAGDVLSGLAGVGAGVALYLGLPVAIPAVLTLVTPTWTLTILSVATALFVLSLGLGITNQVAFPEAIMRSRRARVRWWVMGATLALWVAIFPGLLPTLGVAIPAALATYAIPILGIIAIGIAGGLLLKHEFDTKHALDCEWQRQQALTATAIDRLNSSSDAGKKFPRRRSGDECSSDASADDTHRAGSSDTEEDKAAAGSSYRSALRQ